MDVTTESVETATPDVSSLAPSDEKLRLRKDATKKQIRGSSLLLTGQLLLKGVSYGIQVAIVRYLTKADYGAFAYALAIEGTLESFVTFGLDRAINRYVPIYEEHRDYNKLFGTILMVVGTILSLGLATALFIFSFQGLVSSSLGANEMQFQLLLILVFLAPVNAMDNLMISMFAIFSSPKSIFFRKYILGPGLKLVVVLLLILGRSSVYFLAAGYLAAMTLGVLIYTVILIRLMHDQGIFEYFHFKKLEYPWREVLGYTIPLLTSDIMYMVMNSMDVIVLERYRSATDVAALRAVQPTAVLNSLVMNAFAALFTPLAARMFARNDKEGINNLYWQTAIWIAVITFPIFALTTSLSEPVTILLYGNRYQSSAIVLAILAIGYYFDAALGFNGLTIKVYGKLKYSVIINVVAGVANLIFILVLIPRYGALGGAIGTASALILHNILKQAGLLMGTGINLFEWKYLRVYVIITVSIIGLWLFQELNLPIYVSLAAVGLVSFLVFRLNRHLLNIEQTFPEVRRFPLMRYVLGK